MDGDGNPVLSECGQTQVCVCGEDGAAVWSHPIDVHYVTTSLSGWPSLLVEVWAQDSGGRNEIAGYGMAHVPSAPGCYELDIPLWRPLDIRSKDRQARFLASPLRYMSQSISALGQCCRACLRPACLVSPPLPLFTSLLDFGIGSRPDAGRGETRGGFAAHTRASVRRRRLCLQ